MQFFQKRKRKKDSQRGALVIEATLSLTFFIFGMFTMISLINVAYAQARIAVAVNSAAKEMSQYALIYYATDLDSIFTGSGGYSSQVTSELASAASGAADSVDSMSIVLDLFDLLNGDEAGTTTASLKSEITAAGEAIEGDSLGDYIKNASGGILGKYFMQKNLSNYEGQSADDFLRSLGVVDGLDGISFSGTSFLEGESGNVNLMVSYDVRVLQLLGVDFSFHFSHYAYTRAWGSVWEK